MTLIRELKEADFEQWLELYQVYAEHYRVALTETGIQTTWGWLMDSSHPLQGLVAVQEAALVGMAHFRAMPSPLGGGVGQLLLGELQRIGLQEGWGLFRWITRDNNYRARKLYDKVASKSDWNVYEMSCNNHLD
jgi:GNAT superfamily N-acetyltransferase